MAEQNRRRFYTDILVGRRSVGFKLIGLISAFLLLFFVMSYTVSSGESAPEFDEKGFLFGSIPMIYVDEVMQPLPPIKYGFADYDAEPILKKCGGFYLAKRVLFKGDLPDFDSTISFEHPEYPRPYYDSLQLSLLFDHLNKNCIPVKDGKQVRGFYSFPTAEDILTAVYCGRRYDNKIPEDCQFKLDGEHLSTRFEGNVPITIDTDNLKPPSAFGESKLRREYIYSLNPGHKNRLFAWCDINDYREYCSYRSSRNSPIHFSILNVATVVCNVRLKFTTLP